MIIITVTYPAYNSNPEYSKEYIFENIPSKRIGSYLEGKMNEGRITHVVVKNGDKTIWDSDRKEDWF